MGVALGSHEFTKIFLIILGLRLTTASSEFYLLNGYNRKERLLISSLQHYLLLGATHQTPKISSG
jgi:hypothetical protein